MTCDSTGNNWNENDSLLHVVLSLLISKTFFSSFIAILFVYSISTCFFFYLFSRGIHYFFVSFCRWNFRFWDTQKNNIFATVIGDQTHNADIDKREWTRRSLKATRMFRRQLANMFSFVCAGAQMRLRNMSTAISSDKRTRDNEADSMVLIFHLIRELFSFTYRFGLIVRQSFFFVATIQFSMVALASRLMVMSMSWFCLFSLNYFLVTEKHVSFALLFFRFSIEFITIVCTVRVCVESR